MKRLRTNTAATYRVVWIVLLFTFFTQVFAARGTSGILNTFKPYLTDIQLIVNKVLQLAVSLAVVFFFWGLAKFILAAGDEKSHESGKNIMIWGVIAITVMVSIWGIVALVQSTFDIGFTPNTAPVKDIVLPEDSIT